MMFLICLTTSLGIYDWSVLLSRFNRCWYHFGINLYTGSQSLCIWILDGIFRKWLPIFSKMIPKSWGRTGMVHPLFHICSINFCRRFLWGFLCSLWHLSAPCWLPLLLCWYQLAHFCSLQNHLNSNSSFLAAFMDVPLGAPLEIIQNFFLGSAALAVRPLQY